ncbi:MAG: glycoside hydrolase family 13 protein [Chloroflexota bacterium]|nr:MAG: glycoside hydrolase family 13 protein [Chloroflexota bacterium]
MHTAGHDNRSDIPDWVPEAIFYQIFPDRFYNGDSSINPAGMTAWDDLPTRENFFGGNLQGILKKLDYLQDLGINALYLNPIFKARTNHKYDTQDYFQIDPSFGSNRLFKDLVDEVHHRGMHLILDGVFNHCGAEFAPFQDLVQHGTASPYRGWFIVRSYPITQVPLSYLTCGGAAYLPKLNHAYRPVQEFILKVARYWIDEFGIDGWRLDVPFKIPLDFWREFRQVVREAHPQAYLVGEIWREAGPWIQGDIFHGVTNYRLRELLLDYCLTNILDGEDFAFETGILAKAHGPNRAAMLNLLGSHDTARIMTLLRGDFNRLKVALTYLMTTPGVPLVYYGDEVGLLGETDPDCRRPMPWRQTEWNPQVLSLYRWLIRLRKDHAALRRGECETLFVFNGVFAYRIYIPEDDLIVILNPREHVSDVPLSVGERFPSWKDSETGRVYPVMEGKLQLSGVPACSATILIPDQV